MAFFDLSKKMQVILIASGLAMAPAGCKIPASEPPDNPPGDEPVSKSCASLDLADVQVGVTRVTSTKLELAITLAGTLPEGTEISVAASAKGLTVIPLSSGSGALAVDLDHSGMKPGEVGELLLDVKAVCGVTSSTFRERIALCKQAGGFKILEDGDGVCSSPPAQVDATTAPDVPIHIIVDPAPPPPYYDPPPPPYDPLPPPPIPDPAPPVMDPVPHPQKTKNKKGAAHQDDPPPAPLIVDCVPDAMQPRAMGEWPRPADAPLVASLEARRLDASRFELRVTVTHGPLSGAAVTFCASGGEIEPIDGVTAIWTAPGDRKVHVIQASVIRGRQVWIETWRWVP